MSDLRELYQELILDHGRRPRNFGKLDCATHVKEGYNPLCGDRLTVYLTEKDGLITDVKFEGQGCAISMASASLMTEILKGKTRDEVLSIFDSFHAMATGAATGDMPENMAKLAVMAGVSAFPARVKCATLVWHTVKTSLFGGEIVFD